MEWKCCLVRIKVLVKLYSTIFCAHIGKLISLTAYKLLQPEERSLSVFPWFSRLSHVIFINGARGSILRIRKRWPPRSSITLTRGPVKHGGSLFDVRRQCPWTSYGRGARKSVRWEKERLTGLASVSRKAENRNTSWSGLQESGGMCDTGESPPFLSGQFSLSSWFFPFFFFFFFVIVVVVVVVVVVAGSFRCVRSLVYTLMREVAPLLAWRSRDGIEHLTSRFESFVAGTLYWYF